MTKGYGRRVPTDFSHVEKYPARRLAAFREPVATVNRALDLGPPGWRDFYDQGREGACCGFAASWMMSIRNRRRYDARWLYLEGRKVDEWDDTPPEEGTSVRAVCDVLRERGHCRVAGGKTSPCEASEGIAANRWATTVDEVRTAVAEENPVVFGVNWYANFDRPEKFGGRWWVGRGDLGRVRAGHAICSYAAYDRWQAFGLVNTWGRKDYPLVLIPYETVQRLIDEQGEAALITDR